MAENRIAKASRKYRESVDPAWDAYLLSLAETQARKKHYDDVNKAATAELDAALALVEKEQANG
jgi:hypothetical protein